jgi:tripeptide aminopeptidase
LDGGELGSFEDETFSADAVKIMIQGVIAHPGYAKRKLVNAIKIAGDIIGKLPRNEWCPEATEKLEGFVHPVRMEGSAESAILEFIIRDFNTQQLAIYEARLLALVESVLKEYPAATMNFEIVEQYRNMKEVLLQYPQISEYAAEAYHNVGLQFINVPIRGGTDGSRLSFMGLPCPNIFTGMQAIHSKHEWIGVRDMEKAVEVLVELVQVWERKAS